MQRFRVCDNEVFQVDGRQFLFLVDENAIFQLSPQLKKILDRGAHEAEVSRDELLGALNETRDNKEELLRSLLQCRIIAPANEKASESVPEKNYEVRMPIKTLVLQVTEDCNLGCLYCYHSHGESRTGTGSKMTLETARESVDFLLDHSGDLEEVVLVFFGGEPLLNFDVISSTIPYARRRASQENKKISFAMTTNGTRLSPEIVDFIGENQIGVTVSMDGFQEVHDLHRRFPNGAPSHGAVLPNVLRLLQSSQPKPVVARATVAGDPRHVPQALDYLLDLGFAEAGFAPVTTVDPSFQLDSDGMQALLESFRILSRRFLETARTDGFLGFTNLIDLLVVLNEGEVKNYPCGAGLGLFSVDAQGRLYLCQRLTGNEKCLMGDISDGLKDDRVAAFRRESEIARKAECRDCWVRTICAGGCYHEALVREGSLTRPNLHYCEWIKEWMKIGLEVYGALSLTCPEYLEKLSALRGHSTIFSQII
jgi:uncharacterized protein